MSLTLTFQFERETKGTWRFQEQSGEDDPKVGALCLRKRSLPTRPDFLTVTITPGLG
jgi:hypothetical protein